MMTRLIRNMRLAIHSPPKLSWARSCVMPDDDAGIKEISAQCWACGCRDFFVMEDDIFECHCCHRQITLGQLERG